MVDQAEETAKEVRRKFRKDHPGAPYEDQRDRQVSFILNVLVNNFN